MEGAPWLWPQPPACREVEGMSSAGCFGARSYNQKYALKISTKHLLLQYRCS